VDPHHAVSLLEKNRLCIFPSPIEIQQSPFAWKYYEQRTIFLVQVASIFLSFFTLTDQHDATLSESTLDTRHTQWKIKHPTQGGTIHA